MTKEQEERLVVAFERIADGVQTIAAASERDPAAAIDEAVTRLREQFPVFGVAMDRMRISRDGEGRNGGR